MQSGLGEKYQVQIPKMFETGNYRFPVKICKTYLAKRPVGLWTSRPFYLTVIYNPLCTIRFNRSPMGVRTISNIIKNVMETSKQITNYWARRTLVKRLKQNNVANSEIISITRHSMESGLHPYDSGDEKQ